MRHPTLTFLIPSLCLLALLPTVGRAQLVAPLPITPATQAASDWYRQIPRPFQARDRVTLDLLARPAMNALLKRDRVDDPDDVAGLYDDGARRVSLLLSPAGVLDTFVLSHEYGHYVWFRLLSKAERGQYRAIYRRQSAARALVSDYAETDLEEGFAEAFAFYVGQPATLRAKDAASFAFLRILEGKR